MDKINLTKAYIQRISDFKESKFRIPILDKKELENYPFLLIIQSVIENNIKLTIYPLKVGRITKVRLTGLNPSSEIFGDLSKFLREFQIIHSSGVIMIGKRFYYECYLNLSKIEEKSKNLKASLNKIKNMFEEIKLEEIILTKSNKNKL
jgi:hypothetical protein